MANTAFPCKIPSICMLVGRKAWEQVPERYLAHIPQFKLMLVVFPGVDQNGYFWDQCMANTAFPCHIRSQYAIYMYVGVKESLGQSSGKIFGQHPSILAQLSDSSSI
jgi:hypothetical protein